MTANPVLLLITLLSLYQHGQTQQNGVFSVTPGSIIAKLGFPARLDCQTDIPGSSVRWVYGGDNRALQPAECNCYTLRNSSLYFNQTTRATGGNYTCLVFGSVLGRINGSITIAVNPKITPSGFSMTRNQGDTFVLSINVTGTPHPDVTWLKDGANFTSELTGVTANASGLQVTDAQYKTAGRYLVQATNCADTDSESYDIFIRFLPIVTMTRSLDSKEVPMGTTVIVACSVISYPGSSIRWEQQNANNENITLNAATTMNVTSNMFSVITNTTLTFTSEQINGTSKFCCVATNVIGTTMQCLEPGTPPPPSGFIAKERTPSSITVQWDPSSLDAVTYELLYRVENSNGIWNVITLHNGETSFKLDNLQPNTSYTLRITALRNSIRSLPTLLITHTRISVPGDVLAFKVNLAQNPGTFVLTWQAPKDSVVDCYIVYIRGPNDYNRMMKVDGTKQGVNISDLSENVEYLFSVQAVNDGGNGTISSSRSGIFCFTSQSPRLILEPQDAVLPVSRGTDPIPAFIHCSHNSPDTTVTWYRDGIPIVYDSNRILHPNGTLEFRVLIDRVDVSEDGVEYYCQLTNAFGSVISRTALLQSAIFNETAWPETTIPTNNMVNVTLGSFIMIPCDPPAANPPPVIEWTRDGTVLVPGDTTKYKVLSTEAGGGLIIANVNAADIGPTYRCRITNAFVFTSRNSPVTYQLNQINRYPEDLIIYDTIDSEYTLPTGSNAEFTCLVLANNVSNLEFLYRRLDTPAIPANVIRTTHDATTIVGRTTMRIIGVTQDNAGVYQCVVRDQDALGNAKALGNRNFTIQVSVPPAITSVPGDQVLYTGDTHTLKCEASGFPTPVISYYFNATLITTGVTDGALTLTGVTAANNAGPYQCFADNVRVDSSALWVVTVRDPSAPVMLAASSANATVVENANITLSIDISADPAPTATWTLNDGDLPSTATPTVKAIDANTCTCPGTYRAVLTVTGFNDTAHSGTYTVTVMNRAGNIMHIFQRTLGVPAFVTSLTGIGAGNNCVTRGKDSNLTCTYGGIPQPTVLWYTLSGDGDSVRRNIPVSDAEYVVFTTATETILTIRTVDDGDNVKYVCEATNTVNGTVRIGKMEKKFDICPHVNLSGNQTVAEGTNVTFTCTINTPERQLRSNWLIIFPDNRVNIRLQGGLYVPNDTDTSLFHVPDLFPGVQEEFTFVRISPAFDMVQVDCFNGGATKSSFIDVICLFTFGENVTITEEENTTGFFSVNIIQEGDDQDLSYTWTRNGIPVTSNSRVTFQLRGINFILGGGGMRRSDLGVYRLNISNFAGYAVTYVTLNVQYPPIMLSSPPTNSTVLAGMDHMIQCTFEGVPTPTVVWLHNGSVLTDGSNDIAIATGNTSSTLTVTTLMANETGNYTCMVSNLLGSVTASSLLQIPVDMPPFINEPTVYNETDNVRIQCRSNATPRPRGVTWQRNDVEVSPTAILSFSSIQRNNASVYTCCAVRVVAGESVITCSNFTITVQYPPIMLLSPPTNSTVSMGMDHMIQCKFEGVPTPTVVWSRDGSVLTDGSNDIAIATGDTSSTLTITTVMANETGNYTCMVSNLLGSATTSSLLQIPESSAKGTSELTTGLIILLSILAAIIL